MTVYNKQFFASREAGASSSAAAVLPLVRALVDFRSIVDVGCGCGAWLAACHDLGLDDFLGIDGDYMQQTVLLVSPHKFLPRELSRPFRLDRRFDLAMSLEVAEHLPAESSADFVGSLCSLSDVVLFSAAVPGQGGTRHLNEQWPDYWDAKFREHGFRLIDCIRFDIWNDGRVAPWYRQNLFMATNDPKRIRA